MFDPIVKWSGTKRSQASQIVSYFPEHINRYYEPFCGSCSILFELLRKRADVKEYHASDLNQDLIDLWKVIQTKPGELYSEYCKYHDLLCKDENVYYAIREEFNKHHNPFQFFFLLRNAVNGLVRYNSKNEFNSSLHLNRQGIMPRNLKPILEYWSSKIQDVVFECKDYHAITPEPNDFVYCDPPYSESNQSLYFGNFNLESFIRWLSTLQVNYAFSLNGISGGKDNAYTISDQLYTQRLLLRAGKSNWMKVAHGENSMVYEYLYLKIQSNQKYNIKKQKSLDLWKN